MSITIIVIFHIIKKELEYDKNELARFIRQKIDIKT